MTAPMTWQPTLLGSGQEPSIDRDFAGLTRIQLDEHSWLDYVAGWVRGQDDLFAQLVETAEWAQRSRHMYDKVVAEPRLTSHWHAGDGGPLHPPLLEEMRSVLSARYGVEFDSAGMNLYRDGSDSVAWHRDRIPKEIADPLVVLASLGAHRKFSVRPHGGGASRSVFLGGGDLLVTGGRFQRDWEHSVPKVARVTGPRISIAFRHGARLGIYRGASGRGPPRWAAATGIASLHGPKRPGDGLPAPDSARPQLVPNPSAALQGSAGVLPHRDRPQPRPLCGRPRPGEIHFTLGVSVGTLPLSHDRL